MFDERHFSYEYECVECEKREAVTHEDIQHEDIQDVPSCLATATVGTAVEHVMTHRRGWSVPSVEGPFCPACTGEERSD